MGTEMNCGPEDKVCGSPKCPECERREAKIARSEEISLAILIALVPAMTLALFNGMGLF